MFGNVALDVFIGLVFVYLIYSLLATILQEGFASTIGLRGWVLEKAIKRMLDDDKSNKDSGGLTTYSDGLKKIISEKDKIGKEKIEKEIDALVHKMEEQKCYQDAKQTLSPILKAYEHEIKKLICEKDEATRTEIEEKLELVIKEIQAHECDYTYKLSALFYKHPLIKYLASDSWLLTRKPSYIDRETFSKVVIDLLRGRDIAPGTSDRQPIQKSLDNETSAWDPKVHIEKETLTYLKSIWADSQGDVQKFKACLEQWFDEMMERTTGWYKKYTQYILLVVGLLVAVAFNVDTISIYKILSKDKSAREQLVQMAIKDHDNIKASMDKIDKAKKDTAKDSIYNKVYQTLSGDAQSANSVLRLGRPWDDSCKLCQTTVLKRRDTIRTSIETWKKNTLELSGTLKKLQSKKDYANKSASVSNQIKTLNKLIAFEAKDSIKYLKTDRVGRCKYILQKANLLKNSSNQVGGVATVIGWLLTALALSLGAPFWFDLLNKLMQLRSSITPKDDKDAKAANTTNTANAIKRVG